MKIDMEWFKTCSKGDKKRVEIISVALAKHPKIIDSLFKKDVPEMHFCREEMLKYIGGMSSGEMILARFAIDVWFYGDGPGCLDVGDLTRRLDNDNYENVITAMVMWRML